MQREIDILRQQAHLQVSHTATRDENPPAIYLSSPSEWAAHEEIVAENETSLREEQHQAAPLPAILTAPRSLDGIELESYKINDCFSLFFEHYFKILPIVDLRNDPNWFYDYSPLLFWTIVAIGARKYIQDPTILEALGPKVVSMAMQSVLKPHEHIQTIQSLLLLCTWPFPMDTMITDVSLPLTGVAMQLAIQNGLHFFGRRQDFITQIAQNETKDVFRPRLWSYCKAVCQVTNIVNGLQPPAITDAFDLPPAQQHQAIKILSSDIFWAHKLQTVFTNAVTALMQNIYPVTNNPLGPLIDKWDSQILEVIKQAGEYLEKDQISVLCARLNIGAFHFYETDEPARRNRLIALYQTACSFIDAVTLADKSNDYALYSPEYIYRTLNLAACTLLRISRSNLRGNVDVVIGERAYFSCIYLLKRRMIRNNDLNGRTAGVLTQLWRSPQAFKQKDGSYNSLVVRMRSRGSMGIFFDCFWYWQREFNSQTDPYFEQNETPSQPSANMSESSDISAPLLRDPAIASHVEPVITTSDEQLFPFLNNDFFPDWDSMTGFQIPSSIA
ncbi:hypothetical protein BGW36DRAFT_406939 [Talaromyces proteolyticus]|uniref:Xylanolytic transcriptional activator regulatory domain-containing protein n=1 Tax=Talaromyces proteolyticus TaxID=1131652 RepID=A0AAD4Q204_9EURO|nr:uncharacterized protein BGW36DRAFT_406939 [Talaromyces proteolyticus]KAH8699103.1 hypothetical protein BGW36DRAFT_406939 [Talaromyces proteolyticus]